MPESNIECGTKDGGRSEADNEYQFLGIYGIREEKREELKYIRNRWYADSIGVFISKDPYILGTSYFYASNNPIRYLDILGLYNMNNVMVILRKTPSVTSGCSNIGLQMVDRGEAHINAVSATSSGTLGNTIVSYHKSFLWWGGSVSSINVNLLATLSDEEAAWVLSHELVHVANAKLPNDNDQERFDQELNALVEDLDSYKELSAAGLIHLSKREALLSDLDSKDDAAKLLIYKNFVCANWPKIDCSKVTVPKDYKYGAGRCP